MMTDMPISPLAFANNFAVRAIVTPRNRLFFLPPQKFGVMLDHPSFPYGTHGAALFHIIVNTPVMNRISEICRELVLKHMVTA